MIKKDRRVSEEERKLILELYNKGISIQDISVQVQRNWKTVASKIYDSGISPKELWEQGERRRKTVFFTREEEKEIINKYINGSSYNNLQKEYNCSHDAIRSALKRNKIKIRNRGNQKHYFSEDDINNIIELYKVKKYSQDKISKIYNVGQPMISSILRANGISTERISGERHGNWKNGIVRCHDYMMIRLEFDHPYFSMANCDGYVLEHRLVMAEYIGRSLTENETVHHINGNRSDNRIENLQLRFGKHGKGIALKCANCGSCNIVEVELDN